MEPCPYCDDPCVLTSKRMSSGFREFITAVLPGCNFNIGEMSALYRSRISDVNFSICPQYQAFDSAEEEK